MATAAAVQFREADAGALLRRKQIEAQRAPMLNNSLASPSFNTANEPANNNAYLPPNVAQAEQNLDQQDRWAAEQQRYNAMAASRETMYMPEPGTDAEATENANLEAQNQDVRNESRGADIAQLTRFREIKRQIADQAAKIAADRLKAKAKEIAARYIVLAADEIGGGVMEMTEAAAAETDAGFFSFSDIAYDYARAAVTVLVPPATDVGTTTIEAARYTTNKTIHLLIPPYKFLFGGATIIDLIDDAFAIFKLGIVSTIILTICLFIAAVIVLTVQGVYNYIPGL